MSAEVTRPTAAAAPDAASAPVAGPSRHLTQLGRIESIGPYQILGVLGDGGMGTVYEGLQADIERRVAIKLLHAELAGRSDAQARLHNEARVTNRVGHPGLVQISEVGRLPDGAVYLVMELLRGETLAARMHKHGGALSLPEVVHYARELADILAAAHRCGVIHRDLKPSNVMLVVDPLMPSGERIKLIDFGIAKVLSTAAAPGHKTPQDSVLGTPDYMSPEQCAGESSIDGRSDIYSLGAVLFHMVTGRPPFVERTAGRVLAMHQYETPPEVSELRPSCPPDLARLISELLAKSREDRPTLAHTMERLQAVAESLSAPASEIRSVARSGVVPRQPSAPTLPTLPGPLAGAARAPRRSGKVLLALVLSAGLGLAGLLLRSGTPPQTPAGPPPSSAPPVRAQTPPPALPSRQLSGQPSPPARVPPAPALPPPSTLKPPSQTPRLDGGARVRPPAGAPSARTRTRGPSTGIAQPRQHDASNPPSPPAGGPRPRTDRDLGDPHVDFFPG